MPSANVLGRDMTDFSSDFSPKIFYKSGSSLWRWVKYGHGKSTPYVDPFSKDSLTAPCAPYINNRIKYLMTNLKSLPSILKDRATNFMEASRNFPVNPNSIHNYPGDGYVFFMDPYFFGYHYPRHTNLEVFNFYNYLYSYRHLITPAFFNYLTSLKDSIAKIQIFYEHRSRIFRDTSYFDELNKYCYNKHYQKMIEFAFLSRMFGHSLYNVAVKLNISASLFLFHIYTLLEGFTLTAAKRILFSPQATCQSIMNSVNLIADTRSLINNPLPQKFASIPALQAFHNAAGEHLLRVAQKKEPDLNREYKWQSELVQVIGLMGEGEWYIPVRPIELIIRGKCHCNCIGSYFRRHFKKPNTNTHKAEPHKTLILFSDEAEAEFHLFFEKQSSGDKLTGKTISKTVCTASRLIQCKTKYNKAYPSAIPARLCDAFKGCDISLFTPSLV
jgi:hypothetical protein